MWDSHAHLAGTGDAGSGIWINPDAQSLLHPLQYAQRLFYLNAGCAHDSAPGRVDESYVERMRNLLDGMRPGAKLLLLAFDYNYRDDGTIAREASSFYTPNEYAQRVAQAFPQHFEWAASIHPYRRDALAALEHAKRNGARAVKWLPAAMDIDPAAPRCDAFYAALARLDLPLVSPRRNGARGRMRTRQDLGNPLKLRRALDHGVRVVVAHCASMGEDRDLDRGANGPLVDSFALFARLMDEPRFEGRVFGDLSAMTQLNRAGPALARVIERSDWHARLLNGSDYPLPGIMPLYSVDYMVELKYITPAMAPVLSAIRQHNPLLFDFVLKRHLNVNGKRLADRRVRNATVLRPVKRAGRQWCRTPRIRYDSHRADSAGKHATGGISEIEFHGQGIRSQRPASRPRSSEGSRAPSPKSSGCSSSWSCSTRSCRDAADETNAPIYSGLILYSLFVIGFHYFNVHRTESRWKLAIETWVMIVFITWILYHTGRLESPLTNLYLLTIVTSALTLGTLITLLELALIAACYIFLGYSSTDDSLFWITRGGDFMAQFAPMLLVAYITTMLSADIRNALSRIKIISETDELTGIYNVRAFTSIADRAHRQSLRYGHIYSIVMVDSDNLKAVNDTYGHEAGNRLLKLMVTCIQQCLRETDVFARYGGDEFVLLLPQTNADGAFEVAERIRKTIAGTPLDTQGKQVTDHRQHRHRVLPRARRRTRDHHEPRRPGHVLQQAARPQPLLGQRRPAVTSARGGRKYAVSS